MLEGMHYNIRGLINVHRITNNVAHLVFLRHPHSCIDKYYVAVFQSIFGLCTVSGVSYAPSILALSRRCPTLASG